MEILAILAGAVTLIIGGSTAARTPRRYADRRRRLRPDPRLGVAVTAAEPFEALALLLSVPAYPLVMWPRRRLDLWIGVGFCLAALAVLAWEPAL